MLELLTNQLSFHSAERTKTRKILFRYLRENRNVLHHDYWIQRKMDLNFLGDLSDSKLIRYINKVERELQNGNV